MKNNGNINGYYATLKWVLFARRSGQWFCRLCSDGHDIETWHFLWTYCSVISRPETYSSRTYGAERDGLSPKATEFVRSNLHHVVEYYSHYQYRTKPTKKKRTPYFEPYKIIYHYYKNLLNNYFFIPCTIYICMYYKYVNKTYSTSIVKLKK